jgi:hypothetical protein
MSRAHSVMYGYMSKPWDPTSFCNILTRISLFCEKTSTKLPKILTWKVGVIILLWICHFSPEESRLTISIKLPHYTDFGGKLERKRPLGVPRRRWEYNIEMGF